MRPWDIQEEMDSRHEEGLTDKQGLYQRRRSDRMLTTYARYVLGWAASEEFWRGVKHDLVYELWGHILQLSSRPLVISQEDVQGSLKGASYSSLTERGQRQTKVFLKSHGKKMPNCADTAKFWVDRPAKVPYVQFYAHVICDVETTISGGRRERDFTATDRGNSEFEDWKGFRRWAHS